MSHLRLALALAMSVAIAPFALDAYLPAFPEMAAYLGVSVHQVALTVSVYIGSLSLGQLIGGPLADRYGRKAIMVSGLICFSLTSFVISQLSSLTSLLILRALQAFSGGWVVVCVPALVRDRVHGSEAAKLFSLIGLIMVAAPALAPAIGGLLLEWAGWSSIFVFLGVYGLLVLCVLRLSVFSARSSECTGGTPIGGGRPRVSVWRRYWTVVRTPSAPRFIFLQGAIFSVMMLFVTHASFIYQEHFGVSAGGFAVLFGANVVTMAVIMFCNRRLLERFAALQILRAAVALQAFGVLALVLVSHLVPALWLFVPAMMISIGAIGATSPNCQASYMEHFSENGGTAAALMGAMQFGVAGLVSALSSLMPESMKSVTLAQAACSFVAVSLAWWPRLGRDSETSVIAHNTVRAVGETASGK